MMAKDLPPKENTLFKRILKCYENKQYKNGLKHAKVILNNPKFSEHGETLAMLGLTLNCLGRKEEAYDHVRHGLRNNLQSHVCWHVFGLLQRSDKKYDEAIKCYRNALRWDKDNLQILRDLSLLQIQTRDLEGYKVTRHQLLMLRANQRAGWVGFAIAQHLLGDFDNALNVLQTFRKTQEGKPADYEFSELLLYEASIMMEAGRDFDALAHLIFHRESILDTQSLLEMTGELSYKTRQYEDSYIIYDQLYERNPENSTYLEKYMRAKQLISPHARLDVCRMFQAKFPRAEAPAALALTIASGADFEAAVDLYLQKHLRKGVPPLFQILKHLFTDPAKLQCVENVVLGYNASLKDNSTFKPDSDSKEIPTVYLFTMIFLAQLYDYKRMSVKALEYIERAIQHTPTFIDAYMVKSKIYKHAGDIEQAVACMDDARTLDLADRYLNSKCAKYMLRAGMMKRAEEICAFFTREGQPSVENLNEMQCMWFLTECARTYHNDKDYANTLKKCHEVEKHFVDIVEDQFDFHPYSMRKMTLRAYIGLLRLEDNMRGHNFYHKAARLAMETYLHLYDNPLASTNGLEEATDQLTEKEKKKLESKKKRAAKKKQQQVKPAEPVKDTKKGNEGEIVVPPISGEELLKTQCPLEEAIKFLEPMKNLSPNNPTTHRLAFEIYYRKGKLLLMLQSIKRAIRTSPNSPDLLLHFPKFYQYVQSADITQPVVSKIIQSELCKLLPGGDIVAWVNDEILKYSNSFRHLFEGCCALAHISPDTVETQRDRVINADITQSDLESVTHVYEALKCGILLADESQTSLFAKRCHEVFPYATLFTLPDQEVINR